MWVAWRTLTRAQLREQPLRVAITVLAMALGVALGTAVFLVNASALDEFNQATRRLTGNADIIVRGGSEGFDQSLFARLAAEPQVEAASPMLELQLPLPGHRTPLTVVGIDPFRAAALQPLLVAQLGRQATALTAPDTLVLSSAAAQALQLRRGDTLRAAVGAEQRALQIIDVLPADAEPDALALMDVASAQWSLQRLGRLNRIDLRLRSGVDARLFRAHLSRSLPAGVIASTPQIETGRAASATRAYRINLNMLALVALLTGAFLVFSTQSLAVLRRRAGLGLLRALGVTRGELQRALLLEGAVIGGAGSLLGVLLGTAIAMLALRWLGADLGNRAFAGISAALAWRTAPVLLFLALGTLVATLGAWLPAREAAARAPALALKAGDEEPSLAPLSSTLPGWTLIISGAVMAWLPPVRGVPLPGYIAIAELLVGSVLLVPGWMRSVLTHMHPTGRVSIDCAVAQLRGNAGLASVSLASVIVSFSLMVAMAIMVHSFRDSFQLWLVRLLPADLQLRAVPGSDGVLLTAEQQRRIAALPAVARTDFRRVRSIWLQPDRAPVTLIARSITRLDAAAVLPLVRSADREASGSLPPAWISESLLDQYSYEVGGRIELPLDGRLRAYVVAGVWRDYVHAGGAIVVARDEYQSASGDLSANEASIWRRPLASAAAVETAIRALLPTLDQYELMSTPQLRERSLMLFDRAFAITYVLEAIAVIIGLVGVSVAASSTALARRAQFGMLRHIGMLRRQIQLLLASEGLIMSGLAVVYGLLLGAALSLVLVYVINRQSFNWSIDLSVPWWQLGLLSGVMMLAAAVTALWSGRAAMGMDAVRAVREDW